MQGAGLDPLPNYTPPARERLPEGTAERFPLILITGDREKSYHHSRFRDQPWATKVSPDPRLTMHPDTARTMGLEDGAWVHLEVAGGKGRCRLRVKFSDATPLDVVNTGMGWWLPSDPIAHARRPRRQHQRRARLRRPLGPRHRLLRHPRPAVPRGVGGCLTRGVAQLWARDIVKLWSLSHLARGFSQSVCNLDMDQCSAASPAIS